MNRIVRCLAMIGGAMLTVAFAPPAEGQLVGQLDVGVKNFRPAYFGYTTQIDGHIYDGTGAPVPPLARADIFVPRGIRADEYELSKDSLCNNAVLAITGDPNICRRSQIGFGTLGLLSPSGSSATAAAHVFINAPSTDEHAKGARGMIILFLEATASTPAQTFLGSAYPASGPYSYRITVPTTIVGRDPSVHFAISELHLTIPGIVMKRHKTKFSPTGKLFWTTLPRCTKDGKVNFAARLFFENGTTLETKRTLKCPRFFKPKPGKPKRELIEICPCSSRRADSNRQRAVSAVAAY